MIIIYPMLTSHDVSENAIAGICKTMEKFIIVYHLDELLNQIKPSLRKEIIGKTILGKNESIEYAINDEETDEMFFENYENEYNNYLLEASGSKKSGINQGYNTGTSDSLSGSLSDSISKAVKDAMKDKDKDKKGDRYSKETFIDMPTRDDMSLSPTYIQLDTKKAGPVLFGVKVIPFKVKSEANFIQSFMDDVERKKMNYKVAKYGRKVTRLFGRYLDKVGLGGIVGKKTISGDVKQDIILARSTFKDKTFVLFNYLNIKNSDVFQNPSTVRKLHKLNWGSYVIADDVNQRAFFCMKQFKGLCSLVLYRYMFEALTTSKGTYNNAYEDIQDIKKQATPFFSSRTASRKVFGESKADDKLLTYLKVIEENKNINNEDDNDYLEEDFNSTIQTIKNKLNFKNILTKLGSKNDQEKVNALKSIPKIPFNKIEKMSSKVSPDFKKQYEFSKRVVQNSTDLNEFRSKSIACIAALGACATDNPDKHIRPILKDMVGRISSSNVSEADATFSSKQTELVEWICGLIIDIKNSILGTINTYGKKGMESIFKKYAGELKDGYGKVTGLKIKFNDLSFFQQVKHVIGNAKKSTKVVGIIVIILLILAAQISKEGEED